MEKLRIKFRNDNVIVVHNGQFLFQCHRSELYKRLQATLKKQGEKNGKARLGKRV